MRLIVLIATPLLLLTPLPSRQGNDLARVAFLTGCWTGPSRGGGTIEEFYTAATGDRMLGATRYLRGGKVTDFEFTQVVAAEAGPVMIPQPKGNPPEPFPWKEGDGTFATWDRGGSDFPQRVAYRAIGGDSLIAAIEGAANGQPRRIEWRMHRVKCAGG